MHCRTTDNEFQVVFCCSTMQRSIGRFRYSLKRTQNIAIAADTPANEASRLDFARWYIRITLAGRKILFIDEVVSQGRSPIGVRVQNGVPAIRTRNMNVMSAIHNTGNTSIMYCMFSDM